MYRKSSSIMAVVVVFIILQLSAVFVVINAEKSIDFKTCNMSVKYYSSIGMNHNDMMFTNDDLQVCSKNVSVCCTRKIEANLHALSIQEYNSILNKYLTPVKTLFINYASNFDPKVRDILDECQREFVEVFNSTTMFQQFFEGIKKFYGDYPIDIQTVMQKLFSNLTKLLFNILNQSENNTIDEKCIDLHFNKIEPFGLLLPVQITKQLIKSIDSVKIFTSGLTKLRDLIIDVTSKLQQPSIGCRNSLTKMTKCSMCIHNAQTLVFNKINHIKPCYTYCLNVFKHCFVADLDQLDFIWNSHLNLMQKLSWIIENEINFGNTMSFFKLQISDAIAYYQSNSEIINKKILYNCKTSLNGSIGGGGSHKKKRMNLINNKLKSLRRSSTKLLNLNAKLSDLFTDINKNYVSLTNYWNSLTLNICKTISGNHERCWNGTSLSNIFDYQLSEDIIDKESIKANNLLNSTIWRQIENLKLFNDRIEKHIINDFNLDNSIFYDEDTAASNNSIYDSNIITTKKNPLIVNNKQQNDNEDDDEYEIEETHQYSGGSGTNDHDQDDNENNENSNDIIINKVFKENYYDNISHTETIQPLTATTTTTTAINEEDEDEYYDNNIIKEYEDEEEDYEENSSSSSSSIGISTAGPRLRFNVDTNKFEFMKKQQQQQSSYFSYTKNASSNYIFCKYSFIVILTGLLYLFY